MADLSKLREQIDQADQDLVKALVGLVMEVGRVKREKGQAVFDPKREERVLDKVTNLAQWPEEDF
ncbi:chorismate mutase [Lactobacillus delbrueckii subsp. bulgaricus]|uniref:chorismate mutase n=1 Tax=Lactobacillus delbrueckii TaxID=1584 RepID=UPI0012E18B77|nr:chorismate mutase [Lactobacillus delbrueckii]MBT8848179.1 chorismate mutase [Lactobacillus delbrueckii subsp. bulgaricus]MBT8852838.1 chorismate mutase [Lactobacillus delbrueckii subsp. bulgaricus]MBT8854498.1 chorismate mutase [Lactobacillus delbrueckii subsp. bulgaricus]MBT8855382.1 chorismate mutase [Lactobacillus delbrueckii subsp. bulgaricus]MBT8857597.1 chorismate mutase [Lactobacillus delbrueckii subsp. bulgaricus]